MSEEVKNQDRFQLFNQWCKDEGVVMPKLKFPVFYENDIVGVKCVEDI